MRNATLAYALVRSEEHRRPGHPERPERLDPFQRLANERALTGAHQLSPEPASEPDLLRVHRASYLEQVEETCRRAPAVLDLGDTYVTTDSYGAARAAAGAAIGAAEFALSGEGNIGAAFARPPGHHAGPGSAMGFCLLNNIAIAARWAQDAGVHRILILDFDVHHGNGTQDVFYDDPNLYYLSLHQWGIFPGTGSLEERGEGAGEGANLNIPLPALSGHKGYLTLLRQVLPAVADSFKPELVLVSAGYDAHWRDPLAQLQLTNRSYHEIGALLRHVSLSHTEGRMALVLEGGYDPSSLYTCSLATLAGLIGQPAPPPEHPEGGLRPEPELGRLMDRVLQQFS